MYEYGNEQDDILEIIKSNTEKTEYSRNRNWNKIKIAGKDWKEKIVKDKSITNWRTRLKSQK